MLIRSLSLENFRVYARLEQDLPAGPILLHGANAQGKTSLLEAIFYLATGRSPLTHIDRHLLNWTADREGLGYAHLRVEVVTQDQVREIAIALAKSETKNGSVRLKRQIRIDRKSRQRRDLTGGLNVVLFLPEDMDLVAGQPSKRRRYLDDTLGQIDADYADALESYTDTLRKRNALLRHLAEEQGDPAQLDPLAVRSCTETSANANFTPPVSGEGPGGPNSVSFSARFRQARSRRRGSGRRYATSARRRREVRRSSR